MGFELLGRHDLGGKGSTMQLMSHGRHLYVGNMEPGVGTAVLDVSEPRNPVLAGFLPGYANTMSPKVQIAFDLLFVNYEWRSGERAQRTGFGVFDLSDPARPREVSFYDTGGRGVHRMWIDEVEPIVYLSAVAPGFRDRMLLIVDVADPAHPREIGRWWMPGQWEAGGEVPAWPDTINPKLHHAIHHGERAYAGVWDGGLRILDVRDPSAPKVVGSAAWAPERGGHTHTTMPLPDRGLLVVTDEAKATPERDPTPRLVRVFDIRDETHPVELSTFPEPQGPVRTHGPRFGPHNLHENRRGAFSSDTLIFVTYFSAGLRTYDITDPRAPVEVARHVPPSAGDVHPQTNDVYVQADGLVFTTDRGGAGVEILRYDG